MNHKRRKRQIEHRKEKKIGSVIITLKGFPCKKVEKKSLCQNAAYVTETRFCDKSSCRHNFLWVCIIIRKYFRVFLERMIVSITLSKGHRMLIPHFSKWSTAVTLMPKQHICILKKIFFFQFKRAFFLLLVLILPKLPL